MIVSLLSGGLDSTVLLWRLLREGHQVTPLVARYGQKHSREVDAALGVAATADIEPVVADIGAVFAALGSDSALLDHAAPVPHGHYESESMKRTVVPNRNMILISVAVAHAVSRGAAQVAYGAHAGDHAIYDDCRPGFVHAIRAAVSEATGGRVGLVAPFVEDGSRKEDIAKLGHELGAPMHLTWSCYEGGELHCGRCGTCTERVEAFQLSGVRDPTAYA